jgi:hypothetical protein
MASLIRTETVKTPPLSTSKTRVLLEAANGDLETVAGPAAGPAAGTLAGAGVESGVEVRAGTAVAELLQSFENS